MIHIKGSNKYDKCIIVESINMGHVGGTFMGKKIFWEALHIKTKCLTVSRYLTSRNCMQLIVFAFIKELYMK
jgi:hypothetical protein